MNYQGVQLLAVPSYLHPLTIKADLNGITVLKEGTFKKRYTGSRQWAVDINGVLRRQADLKTIVQAAGSKAFRDKMKRPARNGRPAQNKSELPGVKGKTYSINKPEIRARLFSMIAAQPAGAKELYFWTVTFPMQTEDGVIYRLFNTWLTKLRQLKLLVNYLWVAERQENGTLHFHLAIPHKMGVKKANREMMVTICNEIRAGGIAYNLQAAKRYNGVDIAKNRQTKKVTNFALGKRGRRSLTGYLTKYVTKNNGQFTHLAWHNSRGFSALFTAVTFTYEESRHVWGWRFFCHSRPAIDTDFFTYYPWINGPPAPIEGELQKLNTYVQSLN